MANVCFWRGTAAQYAAIAGRSGDTLYFLTDVGLLCRGDEPQGLKVAVVATLPQNPVKGILYKNSSDGTLKYYNGTGFDTIFEPPAVATSISSDSTNAAPPGTKAVYDFLTSALNNLPSGNSADDVFFYSQLYK